MGGDVRGPLHHSWSGKKIELIQNVFNRENLIQGIYCVVRAEKPQMG